MHNAPSVSYPVGRCAFQRQIYVGLTLVTSAVLLAWTLNQGFTSMSGMAWVCAAFGAWGGWRSLRQVGMLTWDGQVWCLHGHGGTEEDALGEVCVILDVQKALLLRWQPASDTLHAKSFWLWLGDQASDSDWQDLRRAVYQRGDMN